MNFNTLSILVPAYNEEDFIKTILKKIVSADLEYPLSKEIVVVNDNSEDDTLNMVQEFISEYPEVNINLNNHDKNQGKGAALHTGIREANGELIVVQDADLEYDPREFKNLLKPMMEGVADVVYGSRFVGAYPHRILFFGHSVGNSFLTFISNALTNLNLTDMETCYKMFRSDILKNLKLKEKEFGFEPEVTAKMAKVKGIRVYEVGISYYGRTYSEGKKITWKDGLKAIFYILKYNIFTKNDF